MPSPIEQAIRQITEEKGLSYESVIGSIESALAAAYRKDFGNKLQNLEAKFNVADGSVEIWDVKTVVEDQELPEEQEEKEEERDPYKRPERKERQEREEYKEGEERFNPKTELMITEAKKIKNDAEIGDVLRMDQDVPGEFGRMAAMTAKQVIAQKLREAEREVVYEEYKDHEGEVLVGTVQRREGRVVLVEIGRGTAIIRPEDQVPGERYMPNDRIKVFLRSVELGPRGPEILVSRTAPELVIEMFKTEIPEIADGTVQIESIAREAGSRSKVAVSCEDESIDPIGACIGQRGARIQTIIAELGGEKVDIIEYDEDPGVFVMNALAPSKVDSVNLTEDDKVATVTVPEDQLSLAIGRGGQNVRLAARLTDWRVNVAEHGGAIKGSSEGAVKNKEEAIGTEDTKTAEEAEEQIENTEIKDEIDKLVEEEDGDDDIAEVEDDELMEEEQTEEGLGVEELPTATMAESDEKGDEELPEYNEQVSETDEKKRI